MSENYNQTVLKGKLKMTSTMAATAESAGSAMPEYCASHSAVNPAPITNRLPERVSNKLNIQFAFTK